MCIISIMHLEGFRKDDYIQNVVPIHSNNTVKFDSSIKERKKERKNDLEVAHPQCGFSST